MIRRHEGYASPEQPAPWPAVPSGPAQGASSAELERARRVVSDAYDLASRGDLGGVLGVLRGEMERMGRAA